MTKLSPHFSLAEFTRSRTAENLGISNAPNAVQIDAMTRLCMTVLEPVRMHFDSPVIITSGFRCPILNKQVGGDPESQHMAGEAADIKVIGEKLSDVWLFIIEHLNYDQCVAEKLKKSDGSAGWIHVSHRREGYQRGEALSYLGNGVYVKGLEFVEEDL